MTIGELARMFAEERNIDVEARRSCRWKAGGGATTCSTPASAWINPSPNMRSLEAAVLYPGIGLLETTNVSVGRGTDTPFEVMGAPWIRERELAERVNRANPPGVRVVPIRFTPTSSKFAGEECGGLNFVITDWNEFRSFELGPGRGPRAAQAASATSGRPSTYMRAVGQRGSLPPRDGRR